MQINSNKRIELLEDPLEEAVHRVSVKLGLAPVGWIFTDLVADDLTKGTVKNFRGNMVRFIDPLRCGLFTLLRTFHSTLCIQ